MLFVSGGLPAVDPDPPVGTSEYKISVVVDGDGTVLNILVIPEPSTVDLRTGGRPRQVLQQGDFLNRGVILKNGLYSLSKARRGLRKRPERLKCARSAEVALACRCG